MKPSITIAGKLETTDNSALQIKSLLAYQIVQTGLKISKTFGSKNPTTRSFQTAWFERFKWLHHDERSEEMQIVARYVTAQECSVEPIFKKAVPQAS